MAPKQPISDDEIYKLLRVNACTIKGPYILIYNHGEFFLIDILNNTKVVMPGRGGVHNLHTTSIALLADNSINVYDNKSGSCISTRPAIGNREWGSASNGFYDSTEDKIYHADNDWNLTCIHTKAKDKMYISYMAHESAIVLDYNDDEVDYVFIKDMNVYYYSYDGPRRHGAKIVDSNTVIFHDPVGYKLVDISNGTAKETGSFVSYPTSLVLSKQGLVYVTERGLILGNKQVTSEFPHFAYWLLFEAMCAKGFENVELLASLTSQQLFNFYRDQL